MPFSQTLLPEFDEEMKNTRKLLECVPDGKFDYKPHSKSMTLGRLATHVAEVPGWIKSTLDLEVLDMPANGQAQVAASRAELLQKFDQGVAEGRARLATATDAEWQKTWTLQIGGKPVISMPRDVLMRTLILNHLIHHRAQLGVYLRLNEVAIPGMYGPSADEPRLGAAQSAA